MYNFPTRFICVLFLALRFSHILKYPITPLRSGKHLNRQSIPSKPSTKPFHPIISSHTPPITRITARTIHVTPARGTAFALLHVLNADPYFSAPRQRTSLGGGKKIFLAPAAQMKYPPPPLVGRDRVSSDVFRLIGRCASRAPMRKPSFSFCRAARRARSFFTKKKTRVVILRGQGGGRGSSIWREKNRGGRVGRVGFCSSFGKLSLDGGLEGWLRFCSVRRRFYLVIWVR